MHMLSLFIHMARLVYTSYENMSSPEILPRDHNTELYSAAQWFCFLCLYICTPAYIQVLHPA